MKLVAISTGIVLIILAFATWSSYREHLLPFPQSSSSSDDIPNGSHSKSNVLSDLALEKTLQDAAPVFGKYDNVQADTSKWMAAYPDETLLVHMNLPGSHDAATWNYSDTTKRKIKEITDLVNGNLSFASENFRCQDSSLIDMLNAGIRVLDLRYAFDPTNTTIVFWHSFALLSETASLESVLFGFYKWLDDHPSEALLLSFQYEGAAAVGNVDTAEIQQQLYSTLTSDAAKQYIRQTRDELGTLGDARGSITLLRRFDLDKLPAEFEAKIPGLHFSPKKWTVNGANTELVYDTSPSPHGETGKAFIQDYYQPLTPYDSSIVENIEAKMQKAVAHFHRAVKPEHENDLFWHFVSSTNVLQHPPKTPRTMALGESAGASDEDSGEHTGVDGVNHRLVPMLERMKGKRLGLVMFDFYEQPQDLLPLFLSLLSPRDIKKLSKI